MIAKEAAAKFVSDYKTDGAAAIPAIKDYFKDYLSLNQLAA